MLSALGGQAIKANPHNDKLAQDKDAAARSKQLRKNEQQQQRNHKKEEELNMKASFKELRQLNGGDGKRAARDDRSQARKEANKESGSTCEHGIWKCRICNPVVKRK